MLIMDQGDDYLNAATPSQQTTRPVAGTRRYRSKSQRPCDLCRARKVLCNIPDPSQPCQLCERTGRQCTFIGNPNKKQKERASRDVAPETNVPIVLDEMATDPGAFAQTLVATRSPQHDMNNHANDLGMMSENMHVRTSESLERFISDTIWTYDGGQAWDIPTNQPGSSSQGNAPPAFEVLRDEGLVDLGLPDGQMRAIGDEDFGSMDRPQSDDSTASPVFNLGMERSSLDQKRDCTSQLIGYSNESDPFLLQRFPYNSADEVEFFRVTYRKPSRLESIGNPPIHFLQSHAQTASQARDIIGKCMSMKGERSELEQLVDAEMGVALLRLYFKFVFESLPILPRSFVLQDEHAFVKKASVGLLAAVYALALPFTTWDEQLCLNNAYSKPDPDLLWQISYTCFQKELPFPKLSTIQMGLLLINHTPFDAAAVESPFMWSVAASTLAISQALGLNIDPKNWKLPPWEIRLRRRVWWAVVVEHSWRAITHGRSSMINQDDWNVAPLTTGDFAVDATSGLTNRIGIQSADYFMRICSLTEITNGICRQFFSLRTVSQNQSLEALIEQARIPRQQLLEWLETLPESLHVNNETDADVTADFIQSHGSLYVAYYTAHILVLRALLRPLMNPSNKLDHLKPSVSTVLQASRGLMQTIIKFIRGLDVRYQSAFWPASTRHCLSYPGLFCYMLCLQQREPHMASHDLNLLTIWRRTLRTRVQSWPLLRFAVVKIDALFWKKLNQLTPDSARV